MAVSVGECPGPSRSPTSSTCARRSREKGRVRRPRTRLSATPARMGRATAPMRPRRDSGGAGPRRAARRARSPATRSLTASLGPSPSRKASMREWKVSSVIPSRSAGSRIPVQVSAISSSSGRQLVWAPSARKSLKVTGISGASGVSAPSPPSGRRLQPGRGWRERQGLGPPAAWRSGPGSGDLIPRELWLTSDYPTGGGSRARRRAPGSTPAAGAGPCGTRPVARMWPAACRRAASSWSARPRRRRRPPGPHTPPG